MPKSNAFTLIELLIVVAIIAILAAIAVPNFIEAQTRSKVARVKSDMRTLGVAFEAYRVDNSEGYPPCNRWDVPNQSVFGYVLALSNLYVKLSYVNDGPNP